MDRLNNILFSLIAPQLLTQNAECKMQNAELGSIREGAGAERLRENACSFETHDVPKDAEYIDEKTLAAVFAFAKRHDLGHLLAGAIRANAKCKMQNAESAPLCKGSCRRATEGLSVGDGAHDVPKLIGEELLAELEKAELTAVWRVKNIVNEQGRVKKCLEDAKIPFIFLKGAVLRDYYPEPWMRTSSDTDILVPRDKLTEAVKCIKDSLDYRISTVEPHDASLYARSGMHLDMHTLFEGDTADCRLLDFAWESAGDNGGYERFLTDEAFYFYHVAHMAKHMRNGGCGIRPFIDLYLINSRTECDRKKLDTMLSEHGLDRFERAAVTLCERWMQGEDAAELAPLEEYVLTGGVYGSMQQNVAVHQRGKHSKTHYIMRRIFMPYSELKERYNVLKKHPWLTPALEVWRWISLLFNPKSLKRTRHELESTAKLDSERIASVDALMESLGI